jgi:hypothetical protein
MRLGSKSEKKLKELTKIVDGDLFRIWSEFRINDTKVVLCLLPHKEFNDTEDDIDRNVHRNPHDVREWYITLAAFFLLLPITRLYYFLGDKAMSLKEVCSLHFFRRSVC